MCLSKAYIDRNGEKELLLGEVASIEFRDDRLFLKTLFGEQKEIEADIREIDFLTHSIFLENLKEGSVSQEDKQRS